MISSRITSKPKKDNRFDIEQRDIVGLLNEPEVLNYTVPANQEFQLYLITPSGKEIFLRHLSPNEILSIGIFRGYEGSTLKTDDADVVP